VAFACGIAPNLAGLARAAGNLSVPKGATYVYSLSWCIGPVVAFVVYMVLGNIWPMEEKFDKGQVMDAVDGSSISQSDREDVKVPENGKAKDFQNFRQFIDL
jgi:NCS1 family nucleobase:cation symporter-1